MLVITFDWLQMLASLLPQLSSPESHPALLARYDEMCQPDVDAVDMASWLLAVAITAQQIPQQRNDSESLPLNSRKRLAFSHAVTEAVESLASILFVYISLVGRGDFQQAWLKLRHFIALAELMGLPKAAQSARQNNASEGLNEESARKAQAWTLMCTIDRMVCMFINLPPYTRRSPNMAPLPIMADGVVQPSVYLSRLMDIAPEGFGLDDLNGTQDSKPASYTAVLEVAREARSLAGEAPKSWWAFHMDQDLKPDHIVQFVHYCLLMKAHLPIVLRQKGSEDCGYDHLGCIDACKSVAQRYQFIRRKLPPGFFSLNVLDLQAFTAVILLLLMPYSSTLTDLHIFQIDKSGIQCVVAQVLQLMEEKSDKDVGSDFARRGAHTIRSLRDLLQQDEKPGNSVKEITANVPLIGRIRVRRNRKASPNLNTHSQVSSNQGPQAAHWNIQEQAGYSSELNAGISLQNSAIESFMVPEFQWDQLLWPIEDSNNCMLYDYGIMDELN
ncbi:C6 transcription factor [Fusarium sp. NRRL 25303]|nr:C6 transcription factor [Fusarium sp. NRRL 25303]